MEVRPIEVMKTVQQDEAYIESFNRTVSESRVQAQSVPWLHALLSESADSFQRSGLPKSWHERWKYTPLQQFIMPDHFKLSETMGVVASVAATHPLVHENALRLNMVAGQISAAELERMNAVQGVRLCRASQLDMQVDAALIEGTQTALQGAQSEGDGLIAASIALSQDPWVLVIEKDFTAEFPLQLVYQFPSTVPVAGSYVTLMTHINTRQPVKLLETFIGSKSLGNTFQSCVHNIRLHPGSSLEHVRMFALESDDKIQHYVQMHQEKDSVYHAGGLSLQGGFIRQFTAVDLQASGAECQVKGLYLSKDREHHDTRVVLNHKAPHCQSQSLYKGIIQNAAKAVFNGRIHIFPQASGSDGSLQNRNLLLHSTAQINTKPELEIYNDAVKCAHGATVSQLDETELLYLRARGLSQVQATQLLLESFVLEVMNQFSAEVLPVGFIEYLQTVMAVQLEGHGHDL